MSDKSKGIFGGVTRENAKLKATIENTKIDWADRVMRKNERIKTQAATIEKLQNPWISVEDRLPEASKRYLTMLHNTYQKTVFPAISHFIVGETDWRNGYADVTHWMPIPPTTESQGGEGCSVTEI